MDLTEELLNDTEENGDNEALQEAEASAEPSGIRESKADKFLRLAPPRVDKVLSAINSLKKLSAHGSYEYTQEQVDKMFDSIRKKVDECEAAFKPKSDEKNEGFSF